MKLPDHPLRILIYFINIQITNTDGHKSEEAQNKVPKLTTCFSYVAPLSRVDLFAFLFYLFGFYWPICWIDNIFAVHMSCSLSFDSITITILIKNRFNNITI